MSVCISCVRERLSAKLARANLTKTKLLRQLQVGGLKYEKFSRFLKNYPGAVVMGAGDYYRRVPVPSVSDDI